VDVHTLAVGGVRLAEPGADLAVAMAVASAMANVAVPADVAVLGVVGLTGEVRHVARADERVAEARRLGFTTVVGPGGASDPVTSLAEAIGLLGLDRRG